MNFRYRGRDLDSESDVGGRGLDSEADLGVEVWTVKQTWG